MLSILNMVCSICLMNGLSGQVLSNLFSLPLLLQVYPPFSDIRWKAVLLLWERLPRIP